MSGFPMVAPDSAAWRHHNARDGAATVFAAPEGGGRRPAGAGLCLTWRSGQGETHDWPAWGSAVSKEGGSVRGLVVVEYGKSPRDGGEDDPDAGQLRVLPRPPAPGHHRLHPRRCRAAGGRAADRRRGRGRLRRPDAPPGRTGAGRAAWHHPSRFRGDHQGFAPPPGHSPKPSTTYSTAANSAEMFASPQKTASPGHWAYARRPTRAAAMDGSREPRWGPAAGLPPAATPARCMALARRQEPPPS
jgi:hypothetical protein